MVATKGAVFSQFAQGALVLGLVFLVLEIYQLRVAVENAGIGSYDDGSQSEQLAKSLREPLDAIARQLGEVGEAMSRPVLVGDGTVDRPGASKDPASKQKLRVVRTAAAPPRQEIPPNLHPQLASLVTAIQNIEKRPKVTGASVPHQSKTTKPMQVGAILSTLAVLRKSRPARNRYLLMTTKEVLARYGKPVHIGLAEMGQVYWGYETPNTGWLHFRFYDGRVIDVDWN